MDPISIHFERKAWIKKAEEYLKTIRITPETFKKLCIFHLLLRELMGTPYEIGGVLLNFPKDNPRLDKKEWDNIARDAILIPNQVVSLGRTARHDWDALREILEENRQRIVGHWHSHGNISLFHSRDDINYLRLAFFDHPSFLHFRWSLDYFFKNFKIDYNTDKISIEDFSFGLGDKINKIDLFIPEAAQQEIEGVFSKCSKVKLFKEEKLHFLYSIVINERTLSFLENSYQLPPVHLRTIIQKELGSFEFKEFDHDELRLEIVNETNNIVLDEEILEKEVIKNVKVGDKSLEEAILEKKKTYVFPQPELKQKVKKTKIVKKPKKTDLEEKLRDLKRDYPFVTETHIQRILEVEKALKKQQIPLGVLTKGYRALGGLINQLKPKLEKEIEDTFGYLSELYGKIQSVYNKRLKELSKKSSPISKNTIEKLKAGETNFVRDTKHDCGLSSCFLVDDYKKLEKRVEELESKNETLNAKIESLEQKVANLKNTYEKEGTPNKKNFVSKLKRALLYMGAFILAASIFGNIYLINAKKSSMAQNQNKIKKEIVVKNPSQPSLPPAVKYIVKKGNCLWGIAEKYGIRNNKEKIEFINNLVYVQKNYTTNSEFLERINKDTLYVENGIVKYGSDGIKGDNIEVGDVFYIPKSLIKSGG